jgi:hypothetical protein
MLLKATDQQRSSGRSSYLTRENRSGGNDASKEKGCQKEETLST